AEGGVLGVICGSIGSLQATETVKLILGVGRPAIGRLITYSSLDMEFRTFKLKHDRNCPVCGDHPTITKPIDYEQFCGVPALDPASLEETRREAEEAKSSVVSGPSSVVSGPSSVVSRNGQRTTDNEQPGPRPSLDDRGLP